MSSSRRCYPLSGTIYITSSYGNRQAPKTTSGYGSTDHLGLDMVSTGANANKTILSASNGTVTKTGYGNQTGNYIWVTNEDGTGCMYCHLKNIYVKVGDKVTCKQAIGYMGSTGNSSGDHLDFKTSTTDIEPSGEYYQIIDLKGVTKDWLYGRRYRVIVDLGGGEAFDVSNLRCEFEINKSLYLKMQTSKLTIWNLSPENENKLITSGQRIIIEAGYNGEFYGKIFEGNIIQPLRYKDNGVDYKLTLISMDSDRFVSSAIIGISEVAQQSRRNVISDIASKASIPSQIGNLVKSDFSYPRGKIMFGKASDYLEQIAKSEKARYYNEDGKVNIVDAGTIEEGYIFDLGPKTGLINSPVQNEYGVDCECLLNPMIRLNSLFHLDNSRVKGMEYSYGTPVRSLDTEGIYRVIEISYVGDTRGDDWKCKINAITQSGMLPDMALNAGTLIW